MHLYEVLKRPITTEKSNRLKDDYRQYAFEVDERANKVQIRQAVEEIWQVKVAAVNTMRMHGKTRRVGRSVGRRPDWKKAIVTLRGGEQIGFFEGLM